MIGVSGSGKSTTAHALAAQRPGTAAISYDGCREELTGDAGDQSATAAAVALAHQRLDHRCRDHRSTVLDGTHVIAEHRQAVLAIAARHQVPVVAVVVHNPLATCLARQAEREAGVPGVRWGRRVPTAVIHEQHADLNTSLPLLASEGYAAVYHLHTDGRQRSCPDTSAAVKHRR